MFKCHLKNFITGGEGFGQRVVWQNSGKKSLQVAGLIGRPHQDLSPPKGFWRSSHSSQLFNGDFWGCFFSGYLDIASVLRGKNQERGSQLDSGILLYTSGFHWQKDRDFYAQKTLGRLLGLKMRTTSWSFAGQCGLLYQCSTRSKNHHQSFTKIKSHVTTTCEHKRRPCELAPKE